MKKEQIISRNPKVMGGALVFAGTRVPVESLIQHLTAGDSLNKFLDHFPTVSREQAVEYLKMTIDLIKTSTAVNVTTDDNHLNNFVSDNRISSLE